MESCCAAERALVTALVLGEVDPADLRGLEGADFDDPAASVLFEVTRSHAGVILGTRLPGLLRRAGLLRADGYPISRLVEWMPAVPSPVQPHAWAALVVAGSLARQVQACGVRLGQAAESAVGGGPGAGRVLAVAAAQRAALHAARRRWEALPECWRDTLPPAALRPADAGPDPQTPSRRTGRDELVLAGLVAAPQLLDRLPWLRAEDFANPACGRVFTAARRLHDEGHRLDFVTVLAAAEADGDGGIGELRAALRPDRSFPTEVPWLARRMVEDAVIRDAATVGRELRRLGATPHLAGGLGRPMLQTAEQQLGTLRPRADRLLQARAGQARPVPSRALRLTAQPSIPLRRRDDAGRHAG